MKAQEILAEHHPAPPSNDQILEINEMGDGGFACNRLIAHGAMELFFSYRLPYQTTSHASSENVVYPIHSADLLVADEGVSVTSLNPPVREPVCP